MSDVNHEDINLAATYASWNHTRCCCRTTYKQTKCAKCRPTTQICCLSGVHSACGFPIKFVRSSRAPGVPVITVSDEPGDAEWVPGDLCDDLGPTNLCGHVTAYYGEGARCGPPMQLYWEVSEDCTDVVMRLLHGSRSTATQTLPRDWFSGPVTFEDPISRYYHDTDPDNYPTVHTVTITGCVEPVELYGPSQGCGPDDIYIDGDLEFFTGGTWVSDDSYYGGFYARGLGSCCCGRGINCTSDGGASSTRRSYVWWSIDVWKCGLYVLVKNGTLGDAWKYLPGVTCITDALPLYIDLPGLEGVLRWKLTAGSECEHGTDPGDPDPPPPDPPPPPPEPPEEPCTSGCWPPCVMCPTRKTLYAVIDGAPTCCVAGTYALSWVPTGGSEFPLAGYYELPAPVGGPIDTCGVIDLLRVSCVDLTHIQVQLIYRRAEGTEVSNLSSPLTLSVACDVDGMESEPFNIPGRSGDRESLCGFGSGVGGNLRIVSA